MSIYRAFTYNLLIVTVSKRGCVRLSYSSASYSVIFIFRNVRICIQIVTWTEFCLLKTKCYAVLYSSYTRQNDIAPFKTDRIFMDTYTSEDVAQQQYRKPDALLSR